jgi:poly(3-hydroxybutyrate) depolymerase
MKNWIRRLLIGLVAAVVLLGAAAAYLLHAPKPPVPARPAERVTTEFGGRVRTYAIVAPAFQQAGAGVLLVFHRSQSSGNEMRRIVGGVLERIAERDNVIVVYPDGYEGHFNDCRRVASYSARTLAVDDTGFARHIVERLIAARAVDARRVYALGDSNGAHMAIRLALEAPELIAGIMAIGAGVPAADNMDCEASAMPTRRVVLVAGTEDPINPYEGGPVTLFGFGRVQATVSPARPVPLTTHCRAGTIRATTTRSASNSSVSIHTARPSGPNASGMRSPSAGTVPRYPPAGVMTSVGPSSPGSPDARCTQIRSSQSAEIRSIT